MKYGRVPRRWTCERRTNMHHQCLQHHYLMGETGSSIDFTVSWTYISVLGFFTGLLQRNTLLYKAAKINARDVHQFIMGYPSISTAAFILSSYRLIRRLRAEWSLKSSCAVALFKSLFNLDTTSISGLLHEVNTHHIDMSKGWTAEIKYKHSLGGHTSWIGRYMVMSALKWCYHLSFIRSSMISILLLLMHLLQGHV